MSGRPALDKVAERLKQQKGRLDAGHSAVKVQTG
jgi:hypothetical protein